MNKERTDPTGFIVNYFDIDPRFANAIPSGWITIIFEVLREIKNTCPNIEIHQVKEKFAGLRIYFQVPEKTPKFTRETIQDLICTAAQKCRKHCQFCGDTYKVEERGIGWSGMWLATICVSCYQIKQREIDREQFCSDYRDLFEQWKQHRNELLKDV